jgi:hypothetical protein
MRAPHDAACRYNVKQKNFPKELFEVRMYVLKPQQPSAGAAADAAAMQQAPQQ